MLAQPTIEIHQPPMVISYLRFSTPEQAKGDSTRRQEKLAEEWCLRNGLQLTDRLADRGISAFRGKNTSEGSLAAFLDLVKAGTVPPGSVLLVEDLDRLSREEPEISLPLFMNIVTAGVTVVTLNTGDVFRRGQIDTQRLLVAVIKFALAHEESLKKSKRLSAVWAAKRAKIAEKPLTRQLPAWVRLEGGRLVLDEQKAQIVRRMFALALKGSGLAQITKKINAEYRGLGRVQHVTRSFVFKILHNRAAIGEFQPHRIEYVRGKRTRQPVGDPVQDYYPAVVLPEEFYAVQHLLKGRRTQTGPSSKFVNLFTGLLFDLHGSTLQVTDKGYGRRYVSTAVMDGWDDASRGETASNATDDGATAYQTVAFPIRPFEAALLMRLLDTDWIDDEMSARHRIEVELLAARGQIAEIEKKTAEVQDAGIMSRTPSPSVVQLLERLDERKAALVKQSEELAGQLAAANSEPTEAHRRLGALTMAALDGTLTVDQRHQLRHLVRGAVERIDCHFIREGLDYIAACRIVTRNGHWLEHTFRANRRNTMRRDALGHPMKTEGKSTEPQYDLEIWIPADGEEEAAAEPLMG